MLQSKTENEEERKKEREEKEEKILSLMLNKILQLVVKVDSTPEVLPGICV